MDSKTKLAAILLGGYLLGRTKKMKLALTVAGAISGRQLVSHRSDLLGRATKALDSSPEMKRLAGQVTGTLMTAARGAAIAAAAKGVNSLSDGLTERAEKLRAPKEAGEAASAAGDTAGKAASQAGDTVSETASTLGDTASAVTSPLRKKSRKGRDQGEEQEPEEPEDEAEEPEGEEPEGEEPEDEAEEPEDQAEEPEDEAEEPEEPEDEAEEPEDQAEEPEDEEPEEEEPAQRSKTTPAKPRSAGRPRSEGTRNKSGSQPRRAPRQGTAGRSKAE